MADTPTPQLKEESTEPFPAPQTEPLIFKLKGKKKDLRIGSLISDNSEGSKSSGNTRATGSTQGTTSSKASTRRKAVCNLSILEDESFQKPEIPKSFRVKPRVPLASRLTKETIEAVHGKDFQEPAQKQKRSSRRKTLQEKKETLKRSRALHRFRSLSIKSESAEKETEPETEESEEVSREEEPGEVVSKKSVPASAVEKTL